MRKILYAAILIALFFAPVKQVDVGKLLPIRAVAVYTYEERVILETDSGNIGSGATAEMALTDLKKNTPAVVFLDTAEYLLVAPKAEQYGEEILGSFKPAVKVHICNAQGRVDQVAKYLDVHGETTEIHNGRTK